VPVEEFAVGALVAGTGPGDQCVVVVVHSNLRMRVLDGDPARRQPSYCAPWPDSVASAASRFLSVQAVSTHA
jgi:hypothetical protein